MRQRINDISFVVGTRSIDTSLSDLKLVDIDLILNATQNVVIFNSVEPQSISDVSNGKITYKESYTDSEGDTVNLPVLASGDLVKLYVDFGVSGQDTYVPISQTNLDAMLTRILSDTSLSQ